jgi:energy-coupling factor transporter ATP-binding protein EcfA2
VQELAGAPRAGRATAWVFAPQAEPVTVREEAARFRARLDSVLRAGHGVGVSFTLCLESGSAEPLLLTTTDTASERWVDRVLASAYDAGQWRRTVAPPWREGRSYSARRRCLPGESGSPPPEPGAILRTLAQTFRTLPRGVGVRIAIAPVRAHTSLDRWSRWLQTEPVERRIRPLGRTGDAVRHPATSPQPPPSPALWKADMVVTVRSGVKVSVHGSVVAAVEAAWLRLDGIGVRCVPRRGVVIGRSGLLLAEPEVPSLLPGRDGLPQQRSIPEPSSAVLALGRTIEGSVVGVPVDPGQGRHLAIVGETGMGKSSLLVALAARAARLGGVVVLDPLGETSRAIRRELAWAGARVLWVAPGEGAPSINALEGIDREGAADLVRVERRIDDMVHALRRVRSGRYADSSFWGPRLEEMLGRAIRAAAAVPGGTLADAHTLLATMGRSRQVVPPSARDALRELAERVRERPEDAEGARRLLYEVARNPTLEQMLCARSPSLSAREFVAPGQIVLVSGNAARVGESTARYLFSVYLALLWSELLSREAPAKTFVILDEAQWFAHESLAEMLRLARRLNVHVILATQSIGSLPEVVREAVWANAADFVAFRGSPDEARELSRTARGVPSEAILALPRGEAAVLLGKGEAVRWVRTIRLPQQTEWSERAGGSPAFLNDATPAETSVRPDESPHGPRAAPRGERPEGDLSGSDGVLDTVRSLASASGTEGPIEVVLDQLRSRHAAGSDQAIRSAGAVLGRAGALVRVVRGARGTVWWVDPKRIPGPTAADAWPAAETISRAPQPS